MAQPTLSDILSWPPPNYVNPETRVNLILGVEIPLAVTMTAFIAGRVVVAVKRLKKALGIDDWIMLVAWVSGLVRYAQTWRRLLMCLHRRLV